MTPLLLRHRGLVSGFLAGFAAGEMLLALGLWRHGGEIFAASPPGSFAFWVLLRSVAVYGVLGGAAGALLGGILLLSGRVFSPASRLPIFASVLGALLAAVVFAELTVWWQIEELIGLPFGDPERLPGALRHAVYALAAGLGTAFAIARLGRGVEGFRAGRSALAAAAAALVLWGASAWALRPAEPERELPAAARVAVVGLDGLTWRLLGPMLERGELPAFERLVREGAWGSFLTYGTAASPQVWTTLATGKKVRDHGIDDFVVARGASYRAEPIKSFDRRARPVWSIAGDFGRRVAVVNWMVTYPPEPVSGYLVSRLDFNASGATYPEELEAELARLPKPRNTDAEPEVRSALDAVDRSFGVAEHLLEKETYDFFAVYTHASDGVEHSFWRYHEPGAFDPELWRLEPAEIDRLGPAISEVYQRIDRRLGELLAEIGEETVVFVVSDHGQRAARRPFLRLRLERLLAELGWLELGPGGRVDYAQSRAYPRVETPWTAYYHVNLNLRGREPRGLVAPRRSEELLGELERAFREVRFRDGEELFGEVRAGDAGDVEADLLLARSRRLRDPAFLDDEIRVGERWLPLRDFVEVDVGVSGSHEHRGVIFVRGPGVRPGPIGQRVVTTSLQRLIHHLTDRVDAVDRLLPPLRALGLIERASTLDLAPTVLYAMGLPAGRDMAGRPLVELFESGRRAEWIDTYEGLGPAEEAEGEAEDAADEELMERLRALGYVN